MIVINARNVNDALMRSLTALKTIGVERNSRGGPIVAFPEPVATVYSHPEERVLFSPKRNANPTFHLLESLWMLAGRNDVLFPATLVKNMKNFSDDGTTFWGAYGHRWRRWFGADQLKLVIQELVSNPETRRAVLQMWDGGRDLFKAADGGKDVPCNTSIYFDCRGERVNMLVSCRSNDIIWGCYGANAVHMSVLQEYVAHGVGLPVGTYTQMSNDLHMYTERHPLRDVPDLIVDIDRNNFYAAGARPMPLIANGDSIEDFDDDLETFFSMYDAEHSLNSLLEAEDETQFFCFVVVPMLRAWLLRTTYAEAYKAARNIDAPDWRVAMGLWLDRNWRK